MDILVCPGCRTRTTERLDVRTLDRHGDVLACACGRRYPIVDGVPIVMADPTGYLANEMTTVVERDLDPEVAALLVEHGDDDAPYARLLEHVSIYMDNQWGDRAAPPPDGPGAGHAEAILAKLAERTPHRVELAVELGCSVGRMVAELARGAEHAVGLDLQFGAVRRARRLLAGDDVAYGRRTIGRRYAAATARGLATANVTLICGDALDPPLIPAVYQRVVALNLLDSVRQPRQLLSVMDALCAPGGELILSSPYSWQSSYVDEDQRFGGDAPAAAVLDLLRHGHGLESRYVIEDVAELPWTLRRDARSAATYCIHYIRARKGNVDGPRSV
ncbi:MAG: methyltransferase domain-containing protein [Kofleriaceae bacterium]